MPGSTDFDSFQRELERLVAKFERGLAEFKQPGYQEKQLRDDFLDPFFAALGWDMKNDKGLIQAHRDVQVESPTAKGRTDYLFRTDRRPQFICEAKRPAEEMAPHAHQAKRDAWTIGVRLAVLTDFEEMQLYPVSGCPDRRKPTDGLWRSYHFREYVAKARELWDLLAYENVRNGSIQKALDAAPGKLRPGRRRDFDEDFLAFLDGHRRALASDLVRHNDRADLLEGTKLNEAVQCILDRLLFIRICEARGIDTGTKLQSLLETWQRRQTADGADAMREEPPAGWGGMGLNAPRGSLWNSIARHVRALDRRPPSHVPFFNGNLFKQHFSEELVVGDVWLADFLNALSDEQSDYNFTYVAVEILGTIYERFLGKTVRPHGRGAVIEEKPEVRKAGGVYYTPRYIVDYIVEQTVGKLVEGRKPEDTLKLRFLDPACGSGSFLLRVFERVCEHWQQWLADDLRKVLERGGKRSATPLLKSGVATPVKAPSPPRSAGAVQKAGALAAWQKKHRNLCWVDATTNTLHLTVRLKRRILRETVYGVDLDPQAVEVTQLSLYLKLLEGESGETLQREHDLFGNDEPILPPLQDNIKCGNSLIASDFSMMPEDLVRVKAFDWPVQYPAIMKAGGFDAVVGNPPYVLLQADFRDDAQLKYFREHYGGASYKLDTYHLFIEQGIRLCKSDGRLSLITPSNFLTNNYLDGLRRVILEQTQPEEVVVIEGGVFEGVSVDNAVFVFRAGQAAVKPFPLIRARAGATRFKPTGQDQVFPKRVLAEKRALFTSGIISPLSELWDRLAAKFPRLGALADVNFGKQLRDRTKFPKDVIEVSSRRAIPRTHVACVTGKDIGRYSLEWSNLACLNDTVAQSGGCWDEARHNARGKLLTRQIGRHPSFALDSAGYHCLNTVFMVTVSDRSKLAPALLLGVFNSKLLRALWIGRFYDQRQTFPKIKGTYLKELPIAVPDLSRPADKARHDRLVLLVDKMLLLMPKLRAAGSDSEKATLQNAVTATDRQIDALVYELYGLTQAEIALVEGQEK